MFATQIARRRFPVRTALAGPPASLGVHCGALQLDTRCSGWTSHGRCAPSA